ncbi:hypothetical protein K523DRAFT_421989 [Schizophyllum commune Tattone D]|nr:hypothetical protein K523DRAFT_421989 [Schizophyllum commune Tattone D]
MSSVTTSPSEIDILLRYVQAGMRLPMTAEEYCTRLQISGDAASKVSGDIGPLVAIYSLAHNECLTCYTDTYPATVGTASAILTEAQRVTQGLEYGEIVQAIKDLDNASSEEERQKLQKIITDSIDSEVKTLDDDRKQAQEVLYGLDSFRELTGQHNEALKCYNITLDNISASEECTALDLKSTLEGLEAAQSGNASLQDQIADCKRRLDVQDNVVTALHTIRDDLLRTLNLLDPAAYILEKMVKGWFLIDDALGSVHDMVDSDLRNANTVIVDRVVGKLLVEWSELKEQVQGYPQA